MSSISLVGSFVGIREHSCLGLFGIQRRTGQPNKPVPVARVGEKKDCLKKSYLTWAGKKTHILKKKNTKRNLYFGCGPLPATVATRIITYFVGDSYKPSFATVTRRGPHPTYTIAILLEKGEICYISHVYLVETERADWRMDHSNDLYIFPSVEYNIGIMLQATM